MPPELAYNLDNIHLLALCNTSYLKTSDVNYNDLWECVMREVSVLENEGIILNDGRVLKGTNMLINHLKKIEKNVFPHLFIKSSATIVNITFDNLGGNSSLGYFESFRANFFCRICEMGREECKYSTMEDHSKYRTKESYNQIIDALEGMDSKDLKESKGIKRYYLLNDLKYFHILDNMNVDIMHDLPEGILPHLLTHVILYGIAENIFAEHDLNSRIMFFDYGELNAKNIPSTLNLKKKKLGQNASQMKCLVENFPLILYEFKKNKALLKIWNSVETILKILQIVYSPSITSQDIENLQMLIDVFLKSLMENFQAKLIPKHHMLIHYPSVIKMVGPLVHTSTLKYEMKHKQFTNYLRNSNNFINVSKSLCESYQHAEVFRQPYKNHIDHGPMKCFYPDQSREDMTILDELSRIHNTSKTNWVKFNSNYYKKDLILKDDKEFYEISEILYQQEDYYFVCIAYQHICIDEFSQCIEIKRIEPVQFKLLKHSNLSHKKSHEKKIIHGKTFIIIDSLEFLNL